MNRPLDLTLQRPLSALAVPDAHLDFTGDEKDSGTFQHVASSVLVMAREGSDLEPVLAALGSAGFSIVQAHAVAGVQALHPLPRFAVIDTALPGALDLMRRISGAEPAIAVLALLRTDDTEGAALAAGATLTLRRPLSPADVVLCVRRFRAQDEAQRRASQVFDPERGRVPPILESVLATIGHEIQDPLAAALASIECLSEPDVALRLSEEDRSESVDDVAIALRRIRDVMSAVTSLVRGALPELERITFWDCAERAIGALRSSGVRIELAGDANVCGFASPALLEQVLLNLLQNAIDATRDTPNPHVLVRVYRASLEARISVRDNGPGIPLEVRQRIFEPFFTTKGERGTGLGLVLVHHAVGRMGGAVTLGPSPAGAVFRVRLRAA